jgi:hypothetical protein
MNARLQQAQDFLLNSRLPGMGWGYTAGASQAFPEPTCYTLLALDGTDFAADEPLAWLSGLVQPDGRLFLPGDDMPNWATSLLVITLTRLGRMAELRDASLQWLIEWQGNTLDDSAIVSVDAGIAGWPWISDSFSWVQPTSLGALALKLCGLGTHARVRQAEALLLDRVCPQGGWNFGTPAVLDAPLPAIAADTALALFGLQDTPGADAAVRTGLDVLEGLVRERPSAYALALGSLCLRLFDRPAGDLVDLLLERQEADGSWRGSVLWTGLAALALRAEDGGGNVFQV